MAIPAWTILVASFGLIWFLLRRRQSQFNGKLGNLKKLPGPKGLPLIGNMLDMGKQPTKQLVEWTKEYGDIYQVKIGTQK